MRIMRATVESAATRVTFTSTSPSPLSVPAKTSSPGPFSTGTLSPVMGLWSMLLLPAATAPSMGTRSAGRTRTTSPMATSAMGTSAKSAPRFTHADFGVRRPRERIALRAWPMA